jgi:hypothetical protein
LVFDASGVGNNPDPITDVRGTDGRSRYAIPFRVIPDRGKVADHFIDSPSKESCHVLHEDVSGS